MISPARCFLSLVVGASFAMLSAMAASQEPLGKTATIPAADVAGRLLPPLAVFSDMALAIAAEDNAPFVATDGIDGFFAGATAQAVVGRYQSRDDVLLAGLYGEVAGKPLSQASHLLGSWLVPNGIQADYSLASQSVFVHSGMRAVSVQVRAKKKSNLSVVLLMAREALGGEWQRHGARLVSRSFTQPSGIWYLAVASVEADLRTSASVLADDAATSKRQGTADRGASTPTLPLRLTTTTPQQTISLHIAFARTQQEALATARLLNAPGGYEHSVTALSERGGRSQLVSSDPAFNRALKWASFSANSFVVEEFGTGIWAGLPWFRDNWGRDTFIALPGTLLATGQFEKAKAVIDNFARFQKKGEISDPEYGRIPNRVAAGDSIIYNTVDGTPWMIRELFEYLRYSGDEAYGLRMLPLIRAYLSGVEQHWLDENGLLTHDDADTWMDARIAGKDAWSPRGNRAVEIQALYFTVLDIAADLSERAGAKTEAVSYRARAEAVRTRFPTLFWNGKQMADRLMPSGQPDMTLRPNQLMVVSIPFAPFVSDAIQARLTRNAVEGLWYPYGMASLDPSHANFHPRHENSSFHHKDAAYHNGTIWGWNAGFTITALNKFGYQDLSWSLSQNLADQIVNVGTRGTMSELLDALPDDRGRIKPSGTYAQAWSVAEFVRNAYQDYLGFRPDLLNDALHFVPALPSQWTSVSARLPYGSGESLSLELRKSGQAWVWRFSPGRSGTTWNKSVSMTTQRVVPSAATSQKVRTIVLDLLTTERSRKRFTFRLAASTQRLVWDGEQAILDGKPLSGVTVMDSFVDVMGELKFQRPAHYDPQAFPVLRGKDVLQTLIRKGHSQ